jgi:hypothetical protein
MDTWKLALIMLESRRVSMCSPPAVLNRDE